MAYRKIDILKVAWLNKWTRGQADPRILHYDAASQAAGEDK